MEMEFRMELPLDNEGYLRRQCPRCERIFKWHSDSDAESSGKPESPEVYFCPYCGDPSPTDQWFTDEQVDYIQGLASIEAMRMVERELKPSVDRLNQKSGSLVSMEVEVPQTAPPSPLFEPDDMVAVEPPCHPEEPIKVIEGWQGELHCLVCGDRFVLPVDS
jgi:endogenous inhibitor of DNA gyrase (YacG/DUF329 family)